MDGWKEKGVSPFSVGYTICVCYTGCSLVGSTGKQEGAVVSVMAERSNAQKGLVKTSVDETGTLLAATFFFSRANAFYYYHRTDERSQC